MRVRVTKSHSIGYHTLVPYETKEIAESTLKKWIREQDRIASVAGTKTDNRINGNGRITWNYSYYGCPNNEEYNVAIVPGV